MGYPMSRQIATECMGYPMKRKETLLDTLRAMFPDMRCCARTRGGGLCQNYVMAGRSRCRMHGGASLRGPASPRYRHGRYSHYATQCKT